jgi:glutamyl-tRNA synthetase
MEDLSWLGLDWDEGPDIGGKRGPYVQTLRGEIYRDLLSQLMAAEQVYPCSCTRRDVTEAASAPHWEHEGPRYPGTCAARQTADAAGLSSQPFSWRWRSSRRSTSWQDELAGHQSCIVADLLGDFVVAKGDQTAAYQLAVVIDDHQMGVTEVVRGDDLLPSTFRQLEIYHYWNWLPPRFIHVPLVVGPDGRRLAKRHGDTRLATIRAAGVSARALIGWLAWSCGLRETTEPIAAADLVEDFQWSRLSRQPWVVSERSWETLGRT